jgi:hypothetical protein
LSHFKADAPLAKPDPLTFYGSGPKGYTEYPALSAKDQAAQSLRAAASQRRRPDKVLRALGRDGAASVKLS